MQCFEPQEIEFVSPKTPQFNEPIKRIAASGNNSAAFNEKNNMYVWGSASDHKLGIGKNINTQDDPIFCEWKVEKAGFYTETGKPAVRYQLSYIEQTKRKNLPRSTNIISQIKNISWGDSHCVMLDMKGRIFTMGVSVCGRLGLSDKEISELVKQPTQVTFGLPKPSYQTKIIHITTGYSHSVAVTRSGDIYSWGEGSM